VLRTTGVRVEELLELNHHSLVQYRLPTTGQIVRLLQILPSKTDTERLLVVSPELAEVLSAIISRIRLRSGAVPLVSAYDPRERLWSPPAPVLFQRRIGTECRAISTASVGKFLSEALSATGLNNFGDDDPLHYTPHDLLRKSWAWNSSGSPLASASPVAASALMSSLRIAVGVNARRSLPMPRWNSSGIGGCQIFSRTS